jgi:peptidoglycan/LPS O-acetylase OafA/YrhL
MDSNLSHQTLFRIVPLFYFMVAVMFGWHFVFRSPLPTFPEIITNVTLTFGLVPPYTGQLVWGSWAIGVEVLFYVMFPVLLLVISGLRASLLFLVLATVASLSILNILHGQYLASVPRPRWDPSYFAFGSHALFFAFGITAFYLRTRVDSSLSICRLTRLLGLVLLAGLLFGQLATSLRPYGRLDLVAWGTAFGDCSVSRKASSQALPWRIGQWNTWGKEATAFILCIRLCWFLPKGTLKDFAVRLCHCWAPRQQLLPSSLRQ